MLKIKDNIDLKELEKYGFKPRYNVDTGEIVEYYINFENCIQSINIYTYSRSIYADYVKAYKVYDVLYDLIKADLVEKVEE